MVFSSLVFLLVFFPLVLMANFAMRSIRGKNICLCLFSLVFYAWGEPRYVLLMMVTIGAFYGCGLAIAKASKTLWKKCWLWAACCGSARRNSREKLYS